MVTRNTKRGETAARIYALLKRNPDMTTNEIASQLPDISYGMVQVTVSRMCQRGEIASRGKKPERAVTGKMISHNTYHVKYNSRPKAQPKPRVKRNPPAKVLRVVETPKLPASDELQKMIDDWAAEANTPAVVETQPVWNPSVAKPEPTTPMAEREVLALRHLTDIYKALNLMTEQQDALIQVLKGTLADLAETKDELDRERERRNWWDKVKELF